MAQAKQTRGLRRNLKERLRRDQINSDDPFIDRFYRTLWQYLEISRQSDRLNKLVHFCSLHTPKDKKEDFGRQVNNHYRKVMELLEALIAQGVAAGFLPAATDGPAMALALLSLTEGHICMSILEDRISLERIYTGLFFLLFDARQKNGSGKANSGAASAAPL
ncbi:MAG: hypothetical protein SWC96_01395 [Thermodesulfobacteriota bacterium]|nr:hypothetical protein [Thermodesulfobacteriota bacterium]